jgi:hypothetical protein
MRTVVELPDAVVAEQGAAGRGDPITVDRAAPARPGRRGARAGGALALAAGVLATGALLARPPVAPPAPLPPMPASMGFWDRLEPPPAALPEMPNDMGFWDRLR